MMTRFWVLSFLWKKGTAAGIEISHLCTADQASFQSYFDLYLIFRYFHPCYVFGKKKSPKDRKQYQPVTTEVAKDRLFFVATKVPQSCSDLIGTLLQPCTGVLRDMQERAVYSSPLGTGKRKVQTSSNGVGLQEQEERRAGSEDSGNASTQSDAEGKQTGTTWLVPLWQQHTIRSFSGDAKINGVLSRPEDLILMIF